MSAWTAIAGLVVSRIVIVNVEVAVFPAASVAVHVTVVVPSGNKEPTPGEHETGTLPSTRSLAGGMVYVVVRPFGPVASRTMLAVAPIDGRVVSWTITVKSPVPVLPAPSSAVQVTIVEPIANKLPDAGAHVVVRPPPTRSLAEGGLYVTMAPLGPVASAITVPWLLTVGGVPSWTLTLKVALPTLP